MVDVAKRAGVSHQTVSRAINSPEALRSDTLERVRRAIRDLGYRRNSQARALKTRKTGLLGVVSPGDSSFGPNRTTLAIEEAAREKGFATALSVVRDARQETVDSTLEFFLGHGVEAVIVIAPVPTLADAARQLSTRMPVVIVTSGLSVTGDHNVVGIDQHLGAYLAVEHLLNQGHRVIAHIAGPADWFDARGRVLGWRDALADAGLAPGPQVTSGGWTAEDGHEAARQLLLDHEAPQAIFAANDYLALGVIRAVEDAGLRVPDDVSVVGYDDVDAAAYFLPSLTTVQQPFESAGQAAMALLLRISKGESAEQVSIAPHLVRRSSTRAR